MLGKNISDPSSPCRDSMLEFYMVLSDIRPNSAALEAGTPGAEIDIFEEDLSCTIPAQAVKTAPLILPDGAVMALSSNTLRRFAPQHAEGTILILHIEGLCRCSNIELNLA